MNETVTTNVSPEQAGEIFASFAPMFVAMMLIFFIGFSALMFWGILRKAGRPGWRSLVPVYQWGQVCEVAGKPAWWGWIVGLSQVLPFIFMAFLFGSMSTWIAAASEPAKALPGPVLWLGVIQLVVVAGFVFQILIAIAVVRAFGQPDLWALGVILLPYVFYPIIGFGSSVYRGPGPHPPASPQTLPPLPPPSPTPPAPPPPPPA